MENNLKFFQRKFEFFFLNLCENLCGLAVFTLCLICCLCWVSKKCEVEDDRGRCHSEQKGDVFTGCQKRGEAAARKKGVTLFGGQAQEKESGQVALATADSTRKHVCCFGSGEWTVHCTVQYVDRAYMHAELTKAIQG